MPRRKLVSPKIRTHIYVDEDLYWFFKYFFLSPTERRVKQGFSAMVEGMLRAKRDEIIATQPKAQEIANARARSGHSEGIEQPDDGPDGGAPEGEA